MTRNIAVFSIVSRQNNECNLCFIFHFVDIKGLCLGVSNDKFIKIKTKVEAWKFVAKFTLKYGAFAKSYKHLEEKSPIRILLRHAERSLVMIYEKVSGIRLKFFLTIIRTGFGF